MEAENFYYSIMQKKLYIKQKYLLFYNAKALYMEAERLVLLHNAKALIYRYMEVTNMHY